MLQPDIAIIPECASPDILRIKAPDFKFNQCIWDEQYPAHRFIDTLDVMSQLSLSSLYHSSMLESFGKESKATFYWQKNQEQPYHIDFAFLSPQLIKVVSQMNIDDSGRYAVMSDHLPLMIDFFK